MVKPDPRDDKKFAEMIQWLKARRLEARSDKGGSFALYMRSKKYSRLTGEARH